MSEALDMLGTPLQIACANLPPMEESEMVPGALVAVNLGLDGWCRGVLDQRSSHGVWHASCCDVGKYVDAIPTSLRVLPHEFRHLPRLSLAASLVDTFIPQQQVWNENLLIGTELWVSHVTELPVREGGGEMQLVCDLRTIEGSKPLAVIVLTEWLPLSPPPASPPCPPKLCLAPSCEVIVTTLCSAQMVYVRPTDDKEITEQFQVMQQDLAMHCCSVPSLKKIPVVGTLVGARSGVDSQFYRGLVSLPLSNTLAVITMIDYGNREELHCSQLFPLSKELAEIQCLAALVRLSGVEDEPINIEAYHYMSKLVARETELQLTFQQPGDPVALVETGSAVSVNKKLRDSLQGSWQSTLRPDEQMEELINNYSIGKPTMGMMMSTILPLGRLSQFVVLQCLWQHEFVCCQSQDPLLRYVVKILTERMTKYVEESKEDRYVPNTEEICIAQWEDGLWYRAIAMASSFVATELTFLDFGNIKEVPHTKIRRMPHDFNEAPALATYASLAGLQKSDFPNEKLSRRIMELLQEKSAFAGIVLEQDEEDLTATIFIPKIFKTLLEENLIPDSRVEEVDKKLQSFKMGNVTPTDFTGTPEVAKITNHTPEVDKIVNNTPEVAKIINTTPEVAKIINTTPEVAKTSKSVFKYTCSVRSDHTTSARAQIIEKVKTLALESTSLVPLPERTDKSKLLDLIHLNNDLPELNSYATPTSSRSCNLLDTSIDMSDNVSHLSPHRPVQKLISITPVANKTAEFSQSPSEVSSPLNISDFEEKMQIESGDGSQEIEKADDEMEISDGEDCDDMAQEMLMIRQKYLEQMAKAEEEFKKQLKVLSERKKKQKKST